MIWLIVLLDTMPVGTASQKELKRIIITPATAVIECY